MAGQKSAKKRIRRNRPLFSLFLFIALLNGTSPLRGQPTTAQKSTPPSGRRVALPRPPNPDGAKGFRLRIGIEHGHIDSVFIGCSPQASDKFDRGLDDLAPPPGIGGVGFTFLISPDRKMNLYRDIRALADTVQWLLYAKVGTNPVRLTWDPQDIPRQWDLFCGLWDGKSPTILHPIDCRKTTEITIKETAICRFWIQRRPLTDKKTGKPTPAK